MLRWPVVRLSVCVCVSSGLAIALHSAGRWPSSCSEPGQDITQGNPLSLLELYGATLIPITLKKNKYEWIRSFP